RRAALHTLRAAASDPRWRVREAVAMALQLVGEADVEALKGICDDWMQNASLLEMRAIAAGLAHPPLLGDAAFAAYCIETARTILAAVTRVDRAARRDDAFRVLRQGMGYALSVFVVAAPAEGFVLMRKLAAVRDPDIAWIIRENLKKKRIAEKFPDEVKKVALIADEANAR
ncbi:MAG TPA: HEAT repeat domain-containing protein, partial [Spirochaetia bacterium]